MAFRPGNRSSLAQSRRAQNPRPSRQGVARGDYGQRHSDNVVTPEPVTSDAFSFERVRAFQCVAGVQYSIPEISNERQYFTKQAARAIIVINTDAITPKSILLEEFAKAVEPLLDQDDELEDVMKLLSIQYGQLTKKTLSDKQILTSRPAPANDPAYVPEELFESFNISTEASGTKSTTKRYVQAPRSEGGWYAELTGDRGLKYKVALDFSVKIDMNEDEDGDGPYGPQHTPNSAPVLCLIFLPRAQNHLLSTARASSSEIARSRTCTRRGSRLKSRV